MIGAIAGDIIGSVYESSPIKTKDFPLFHPQCCFTDDSVLTVAIADAIISGNSYEQSVHEIGRQYPDAGYGGSFIEWLDSDYPEPYNSWGNGSAMRVSPIGFAFNSEDKVLSEAEKTAIISHNHPEGIKGAQATALAIFLARNGESKEDIRKQISRTFGYDLHPTVDDIRPAYSFDISCQGTVPDSNSEIAISMLCKAISIQKDEDFLGDIRIFLAKLLIDANNLKEAKNELNIYKEHRIAKGWKIAEVYESLSSHLQEINVTSNNSDFYVGNSELAEEYIYNDIPWKNFLLYDKWENKNQQKVSAFTDLNNIEFIVKINKFEILVDSSVNAVIQFKIHYDKTNNRYIALQAQESTCTYTDLIDNALTALAIVDHINEHKKLFHYVIDSTHDGIVHFSQTKLRPNVGNFLKIKYFLTYNEKQNKRRLHILDVNLTKEENQSLIKTVSGDLKLKYKHNDRTVDYQDIIDDEMDIDTTKPDFAFIEDYYVPKYLLRNHRIYSDCKIIVKVLYGDKPLAKTNCLFLFLCGHVYHLLF